MRNSEPLILGISIGDLNGIGGEIILKTFQDERMLEFCTPIIFASAKTISFLKNHFGFKLNFHGINDLEKALPKKINVFNTWKEQPKINFGQEDPKIGQYAIKSLKAAVSALKNKTIDALVTAPVNKHTIQSKEFKFPGHTDFLAQELNGNSLMLMVNDTLRVGLLTDHLPVKDVPNKIDAKIIRSKIETIHDALVIDFRITKPKIAVLGINPHVGDNGVIGEEDDNVMKPTLKSIREEGTLVFGPYAADSFFGSNNYKQFDAIIASYHDQGLIPFKMVHGAKSGVQLSLGLPFLRTSVDHGTAKDIFGKNKADSGSMENAITVAIKLLKNKPIVW